MNKSPDNKKQPGTISEFGVQWTSYTENSGYYASDEVLDTLFGQLLDKKSLAGKKIADVGAGSGRYTRLFHSLGAGPILALEPSAGFDTLKSNTADIPDIQLINDDAENLPAENFDWVFCIGVLQFIPDAEAALRAMGKALGPNGKVFVWVYGRENNGLYLAFLKVFRAISSRMSHRAKDIMSRCLVYPASFYGFLCSYIPLPMADYLKGYFMKLNWYSRKLVVYDQLNPSMSKYYARDELEALFSSCGFKDIEFHHRLNTSWSVTASYQPDSL
jgi:ubiquinone/menaquinone biosynthesis C-methylase UbiE